MAAALMVCFWIVTQGYKRPHGGHIVLMLSAVFGIVSIPLLCGGLGLRYLRSYDAVLAHLPLFAFLAACGLVALSR